MLLSAREVSRTYGGRRALARTDFDLHSGEVVALVGPNGAGKSTLLAVLAGALRPSSGELSRSEPPPRTGWVPQRPAQYGHLSARENLVLFARLARLDDATAAVDALLVRFGLPSGGQPAAQLSVGNQQRLNLALGLLGEPEVLLLDEPAASLDPRHRRLLWEAVESVRRGGGAVAFATHVMEEADRHATRVVALLDGEVVFAGRPGDLAGAVPELVSP